MPRPNARHGRGAPENRTPTRFGLAAREADGDWLDVRDELDGDVPPLRTTVTIEKPKTIIALNNSPDIGFDRSINAYRGCEQDRHRAVQGKSVAVSVDLGGAGV